MYLEKWYADWVDAQGQSHILYLAQLRMGPLSVGYSGTLGTMRRAQLWWGKQQQLPRMEAQSVHWPCVSSHGALRWSNAEPAAYALWQRQNACVSWEPFVRNGLVTAADGQLLGRGYVERLVLDVAPWKLGLRLLKWGRFCGGRHSLIWIEWQGCFPLQLAWMDGEKVPLRSVSRAQVHAANAHLDLLAVRPIVHETLNKGALQPLGNLRRLATPAFLAGVESKWIAEAELHVSGQESDRGHAIYEEVQWP